jgi:cyclopropane fatty-acyl-phospholipid synthase-like methyltransferase
MVSWLVVHQIPERPLLFTRLARTLRSGGHLYIEDLGQRGPFSAQDAADVRDMLYAATMTGPEDYDRELCDAGFTRVDITDMTADWAAFCAGRAAAWRDNRERHMRVHGEHTYSTLERFFSAVEGLFARGNLGGWRIVATC